MVVLHLGGRPAGGRRVGAPERWHSCEQYMVVLHLLHRVVDFLEHTAQTVAFLTGAALTGAALPLLLLPADGIGKNARHESFCGCLVAVFTGTIKVLLVLFSHSVAAGPCRTCHVS